MDQKKIKSGILVLVFLLFIGALVYLWLVPKAVEVQTAEVRRGIFQEVVQADGYLRSRDRWLVAAKADGDMKQMNFRVGDSVAKGQVLTELLWDVNYEPIRSPAKGVISKVLRDSPGPIRRGEPIVEIVDPERPEVVAELLTTDAVRVQIGNPVTVTGWGGDAPLHAEVIRISRAGFTKPSALGVEEERTEVVSKLDQIPPQIQKQLGSNFHVEVQIEVAEHPNALIVPTGAIFRDQDHWAVYKLADNHAIKSAIDLSARGNETAMISKGLNEGDQVIVYPGDLVKPGSRVKAR